jgi:hypothetical protein
MNNWGQEWHTFRPRYFFYSYSFIHVTASDEGFKYFHCCYDSTFKDVVWTAEVWWRLWNKKDAKINRSYKSQSKSQSWVDANTTDSRVIHHIYPEERGRGSLQNFGLYLHTYTADRPRRLHCIQSLWNLPIVFNLKSISLERLMAQL